jgi:hypothetical protein
MATPIDVDRVEDVTEEHLGGASTYELAAFKLAVWEYQTDAEVPIWTALAVVWKVVWTESGTTVSRCPPLPGENVAHQPSDRLRGYGRAPRSVAYNRKAAPASAIPVATLSAESHALMGGTTIGTSTAAPATRRAAGEPCRTTRPSHGANGSRE